MIKFFKGLVGSRQKEVVAEIPSETPLAYEARMLEGYCARLRDDVKQELDASVQPMDGSYEERLNAFSADLDQIAQLSQKKGALWMSLRSIYSSVRKYGMEVVAEEVVLNRLEWGVV